jgi:hypothetical protein
MGRKLGIPTERPKLTIKLMPNLLRWLSTAYSKMKRLA